MIVALSALILVIGGLRTLAVVFSPEKYEKHQGAEEVNHG
jgi:uncharacterized membrane protein